MKSASTRVTIALGALFFLNPFARAAAPRLLPFQGRLTDASGAVVPDGAKVVQFKIYDAPTGGTAVWNGEVQKVTVNGGLVSTLLGSKADLSAVDFNQALYLEITVDANADNQITAADPPLLPRQSILPAIFAVEAASADSAKTVADGAITSAKIANGAVGSAQMSPGAAVAKIAPASIGANLLSSGVASANLAASGQSGVNTGGIILSADSNSATLTANGYLRLGSVQTGEGWKVGSLQNAPSPRSDAACVWTGEEFIVWGGTDDAGGFYGDGARYNPRTNTWMPIPVGAGSNAPAARAFHYDSSNAVWTGTELIIWGGFAANNVVFGDGARYKPGDPTWTSLPTAGAPAARVYNTAVWMPERNEMFIWGGASSPNGSGLFGDGRRYSHTSDSWLPVALAGAPTPRQSPEAVWTGTAVIVWGGADGNGVHPNTGARFDPNIGNGGSWTQMSTAGAPDGRTSTRAVWSGTEMIVWGGFRQGVGSVSGGGRYNPAVGPNGSWQSMETVGQPSPRHQMVPVWTGTELIVWGGVAATFGNPPTQFFSDGARYSPTLNAWLPLPPPLVTNPRNRYVCKWSGSELFIFGGGNPGPIDLPTLYTPPRTLYLYQRP